METQKKLMKHSPFLVFKICIFILFLSILSGCFSRMDDAWNKLMINNISNDTIVLRFTKKYIMPESFSDMEFPPNKTKLLTRSLSASDFEIIKNNWGNEKDTIEIHRYGKIYAKWGGPLLELPDSVHSFYNKNSWIISNGGRKDKYIIATFTLTDEDFKPE